MPLRASLRSGLVLAALAIAVDARAQTPPSPAPPPAGAQATAGKPLADSLSGLAKAEYEAGKVLFADGDFTAAIAKFERAHELSRDPRLLWNIAVCQKNLRRYSRMLTTIERYRKDGAGVLTAEERAQADEIVETVRGFISELTLTVSEPGADVQLDDDKMGTTPLRSLSVDVGRRTLRVTKRGFKPVVRPLSVAGGGKLVVDVVLEREVHRGRVRVAAGRGDLIAIDGRVVGRGAWEGSLPSGGHTLRVTAPGMAAYQSEVVVQDDQIRKVDVTLNPLPRDTATTVLWIAGGAALVAGAVIGGAVLFSPTEAPTVQGTISPGTVQLGRAGRR